MLKNPFKITHIFLWLFIYILVVNVWQRFFHTFLGIYLIPHFTWSIKFFICRILLVTTRTKVICLKWSDWINLYLLLKLSMIKKEPLLFYLIPKCQVCKKSTMFGKDEIRPCSTVNLFNLRAAEEIGVKLFITLLLGFQWSKKSHWYSTLCKNSM